MLGVSSGEVLCMINGGTIELAIKKFPFFQSLLNDDEKRKMLTYQKIEAGTYAFHEGEYYPFIPLVLKGTLRVSKIGETGKEIVLYRVSHGESCILLISSALSNQPYTATAYVEEETEVINVPVQLYQQEMSTVDLARTFTYQLYNRRFANMMSLVEEIIFNKMDKRIAELLLSKSSEQSSSIKITHEALAIELGTAREVVSRVLKEFEKKDLLSLNRGKIVIKNLSDFLLYSQTL